MRKFILSENGLERLKQNIIKEACYEDHVNHGSKYLTANYKAIPYDNGKGKIVGGENSLTALASGNLNKFLSRQGRDVLYDATGNKITGLESFDLF